KVSRTLMKTNHPSTKNQVNHHKALDTNIFVFFIKKKMLTRADSDREPMSVRVFSLFFKEEKTMKKYREPL
ncbi:MAG: hypothetical protein LAT51_06325, partial [Flavobacteriaceae bacterium]|nr:hypothetical protein [Flavobacteriaceae bacterium]